MGNTMSGDSRSTSRARARWNKIALGGRVYGTSRQPVIWLLQRHKTTFVRSLSWNRSGSSSFRGRTLISMNPFGADFETRNKQTGEKLQLRCICKDQLVSKSDEVFVRRQLMISSLLSGHPNALTVHEAYEDRTTTTFLMDLCTGGDLLLHLLDVDQYNEVVISQHFRSLVDFVLHAHHKGIAIRVLQPEHILLSDSSPDAVVKVVDVSSATFCPGKHVLTDPVGPLYCQAPEVLQRKYGREADVWSLGVLLCMMLTGLPPFSGYSEAELRQAILTEPLSFLSLPGNALSYQAKHCLACMLDKDPHNRITCEELLHHPWLGPEPVPDVVAMQHFLSLSSLARVSVAIAGTKRRCTWDKSSSGESESEAG